MIQKPYDVFPRGGQVVPAEEELKITWKVSGSISVAFSIVIQDNEDNTLVWELPKTTSYAQSYTLSANTLPNEKEYKITITVWDENGNSATSDAEIFQTSARPVVVVDVPEEVQSDSYNFTASYSQSGGVPLRSYIAYLYNSNGVRIDQSNIKMSEPIEHLFSNLVSNETYYVEFQVTSEKGLVGSSGLIEFYVNYEAPTINVQLVARNIEDAGIELSWYVVQIIGKSDFEVVYIDNEKACLLDGNRVWFDEGFSVEKNFTLKLWIEHPLSKRDLLIINGVNGILRLQYDYFDSRFHLYKRLSNSSYVSKWSSQPVNGEKFFVCIQQINNDMNLMADTYT